MDDDDIIETENDEAMDGLDEESPDGELDDDDIELDDDDIELDDDDSGEAGDDDDDDGDGDGDSEDEAAEAPRTKRKKRVSDDDDDDEDDELLTDDDVEEDLDKILKDRSLVSKVFDDLAKRDILTERQGGYTRILKLGQRRGDGASLSLVSWIGSNFENTESLRYPEELLKRFEEVDYSVEYGDQDDSSEEE